MENSTYNDPLRQPTLKIQVRITPENGSQVEAENVFPLEEEILGELGTSGSHVTRVFATPIVTFRCLKPYPARAFFWVPNSQHLLRRL